MIVIVLGFIVASGAGCFTGNSLTLSIDSAPDTAQAGVPVNVVWSVSGVQDTFYHGAVHYGPFSVTDPQDTSDYPNHLSDLCDSGCSSPGIFTSSFSIPNTGTYFYRVHVTYNGSDYWSNEKSITIEPSQNRGYAETISITSSGFEPDIVFARQGDIILWVNNDRTVHSVTSDSGTELSSGAIQPGASYSHTFNNLGAFTFHDSFYPGLTGSIVIE